MRERSTLCFPPRVMERGFRSSFVTAAHVFSSGNWALSSFDCWRGNKDESAKFSMGEATQRVALSCCYSRPRPYFPFPFFAYFHLPFSVICFRVCSLPITLATVFLTDWLRKIITFTLSQFSNFPDFFLLGSHESFGSVECIGGRPVHAINRVRERRKNPFLPQSITF